MNTYANRSLVGSLKMNSSSYDLFEGEDLYSSNQSHIDMMGLTDFLPSHNSLMEPFNHDNNYKVNETLTIENDRLRQEIQFYQRKVEELQGVMSPNSRSEESTVVSPNDEVLEILDDVEYPFPIYTVTESTVRPYPVMVVNYDGNYNNLLVKAEPAPGYKFKMENHIAHFKTKDQSHIQKRVGKIIVFEELQICEIGNAEGEPVQIDFSLYSIDGMNPTLIAAKRSRIITVFNHSQYLPAPDIVKLIPEYCLLNEKPKVDAFGPLFLRKNNILECEISEDNGKEYQLLAGKEIIRKRNCFHSFTFVAPQHKEGKVNIRARYKNRDFGVGKLFYYISQPTPGESESDPLFNSFENHGSQFDNDFSLQNTVVKEDPKVQSSVGYYAFQGNYDGLSHALVMKSKNSGINDVDEHGMTCLHWATLGGHVRCVQLLLEKEANPNIVSNFSETPLHIASRLGFTNIATLLIEHDANVVIPTKKNTSTLHYAALSGNCTIMQMILDSDDGIDLLIQYDRDRLTPLHYAVMKGQHKAVKFLLEFANDMSEDLIIGDANIMTPLHWAVALGEIECVRELLEYCNERQVNMKDQSGRTALFYSVDATNIEICRELLTHKADPNAQDNIKETPLFSAVESSSEIVSLLVEYSADANIVNIHNETPFKVVHGTTPRTPNVNTRTPKPKSRNLEVMPEDIRNLSKHREEISHLKKDYPNLTMDRLNILLDLPNQMKKLEMENENLKMTVQGLEEQVSQLFTAIQNMPTMQDIIMRLETRL